LCLPGSSRWPPYWCGRTGSSWRAVGYVARHGAAQFIEVGSGLPASPGTHEIAALAWPGMASPLGGHGQLVQARWIMAGRLRPPVLS